MLRYEMLFESENDVEIKKVYGERSNFTPHNCNNFKEAFRMTEAQVNYVLGHIEDLITPQTNRSMSLTARQKLLITLNWLGNGSQYHAIGRSHGVSKSSVYRVMEEVIDAIISTMLQSTVKWPDDVSTLAADFQKLGGFPFVCGCVDGILIKIDAPNDHEEHFVDRHGNHSLNVQMICGPDHQFYSINASWPGSTHDARVMRNTAVYRAFEGGWRPFPGALVLGDTAYGYREWLIPSLPGNPDNLAEQRLNRSHKTTRRVIECSFGILKEKFPCLNHLRVNPEKAGKIVVVCGILHNVALKIKIADENTDENGDENADENGDENADENETAGDDDQMGNENSGDNSGDSYGNADEIEVAQAHNNRRRLNELLRHFSY